MITLRHAGHHAGPGHGAGRSTRRRRAGFPAVGLLALALEPAAAADLPAPAPAAPGFDWTGFYLGGHVGLDAGAARFTASTAAGPPVGGAITLFDAFDAFKGTGSYVAGLQAGYNVVLPSGFMVGVEADLSAPDTVAGTRPGAAAAVTDTVFEQGTVRGRVGRTFDNWLAYGTAGLAWSYDQLARTPAAAAAASDAALLWRFGFAAGAGVEVPLGDRWTGRLEYLVSDFPGGAVNLPTGRVSSDLLVQSLRVGVDYQLGVDPATSGLFTTGPAALGTDSFAVHGQTTFVSQYAAPFRAPYSGAQSLIGNSGRETWDANLYLGYRPWAGGELWINPEIDQGFGLADTFGVAAFPSAEAYKVGASLPYARLPRMFFRQTIDLGGDIQKVDADINQFATVQTADRLVLTVGKFSVVDIFDANKYAHDPRNDFLNWLAVDTGAFDYAADAWSYTWGGALEWYTGPWTFRAGIFDAPVVPNATDLDSGFRQFQVVGEIERRYELLGRPGKIAVTGYLTRARLGNFGDAIALAQETGGVADLALVRTYTSKSGIAGNLEQELAPDLGAFLRAGWTPGNVEADAFTDADATVSGGFSLGGKAWGRPDDHVGIAGILSTISGSHQAYLAAGGLTALLGDGMLPHPGPEQVLEAYYRLPVLFWQATLDYQFIVNPGYNRDRGPASVIALRLHTQF